MVARIFDELQPKIQYPIENGLKNSSDSKGNCGGSLVLKSIANRRKKTIPEK